MWVFLGGTITQKLPVLSSYYPADSTMMVSGVTDFNLRRIRFFMSELVPVLIQFFGCVALDRLSIHINKSK